MTNLLQIFIRIFLFSAFCALIIWNRLLREFFTKDLNQYRFPLSINIIFILLFSMTIILSIIIIKGYFVKKHPNEYIKKSQEFFYAYFASAPETILGLISKKIDLISLIRTPVSYFVAYVNYPKILTICFIFLPPIIVSTMFFIEVIFYHKIHYFYACLPLLLISLVFSACIYSIDLIAQAQLDYVCAHLIGVSKNGILQLQLAPEPPNIFNALTFEEMQEKFFWLCCQYEIFSEIKHFCVTVTTIKNRNNPWITLFSSLLFLLSWFYILVLHFSIF